MKRDGLERARWIESIDTFVKQHGRETPRWAILLTYSVELDRLARVVLPVLDRRGRRFRTTVLADQGALEQSLQLTTTAQPGVNVHSVRCKTGGVFHPKLVFLRAGRHVRACFGSANITDGGLGANLELWTYTDSVDIVGGLVDFLHELTVHRDIAMDGAARRSIRRATTGLTPLKSPAVWSSLSGSFKSRLREGRERRMPHATIISPMFASEGGLKAARTAIPAKDVSLFTSEAVQALATRVRVYTAPEIADGDEDVADTEAFPRRLHAKAYLFSAGPSAPTLAWIGSANFTAQALTKDLSRGGNVELLIRTSVPPDEMAALQADLAALFQAPGAGSARTEPQDEPVPRPKATILGGELVSTVHGPRLVLRCIEMTSTITLARAGYRYRVRVRSGRGVVHGSALRRLIPDLTVDAPRALVIHQIVRGVAVPLFINVPHVPPDDEEGVPPQATLDSLLDEFLGRIPSVRSAAAPGVGDDVADEGDDEDADASNEQFERRLDEVRHQGALDQLAVKAALLEKLAIRSTPAGTARRRLLDDILDKLLQVSDPHLRPLLKKRFEAAARTR